MNGMEMENILKKKKGTEKSIPLGNALFILLLIISSIGVGFVLGQKKNSVTPSIARASLQKQVSTKDNAFSTLGSVLGTVTSGAEERLKNMVNQFTETITNTASQSAKQVSDAVFDSTVGTVLKQIDKLPAKQQEDIRRNICK